MCCELRNRETIQRSGAAALELRNVLLYLNCKGNVIVYDQMVDQALLFAQTFVGDCILKIKISCRLLLMSLADERERELLLNVNTM